MSEAPKKPITIELMEDIVRMKNERITKLESSNARYREALEEVKRVLTVWHDSGATGSKFNYWSLVVHCEKALESGGGGGKS